MVILRLSCEGNRRNNEIKEKTMFDILWWIAHDCDSLAFNVKRRLIDDWLDSLCFESISFSTVSCVRPTQRPSLLSARRDTVYADAPFGWVRKVGEGGRGTDACAVHPHAKKARLR